MSAVTDPEASRIPENVFETPDAAPVAEVGPAPTEFDDVLKQIEPRVWVVEGEVLIRRGNQDVLEPIRREYVQEPLSYNGIVQFVGLLSRKIEEVMSGDNGLSLGNIVELASMASSSEGSGATEMLSGMLAAGDFNGIDQFVRGFMKLVSYVPDIIDEAQCIWLRVPFRDRMLVREIWSKPPGKGGLTRKEGGEMFNVFIAQNYEELEGFLLEETRGMLARIQKERKRIHPAA